MPAHDRMPSPGCDTSTGWSGFADRPVRPCPPGPLPGPRSIRTPAVSAVAGRQPSPRRRADDIREWRMSRPDRTLLAPEGSPGRASDDRRELEDRSRATGRDVPRPVRRAGVGEPLQRAHDVGHVDEVAGILPTIAVDPKRGARAGPVHEGGRITAPSRPAVWRGPYTLDGRAIAKDRPPKRTWASAASL